MENIRIDVPTGKRLVWYLAAEEYFARQMDVIQQRLGKGSAGLLFTWVVSPTVIFGRHQVMVN